MNWVVSINTSRFRSYSQTDTTLTIDGSPAENAANDCGPKLCSDALWYITGVEKYPDTIKDEGWGPLYVGVTDAPKMKSYMASKNSIPMTISHPTGIDDLGNLVYKSLFAGHFCGFFGKILDVTNKLVDHWYGAVTMVGGATSFPFDTITTTLPEGQLSIPKSYQWFVAHATRYVDGNYYVVTFDRGPSPLS